MRSTLPGNIPVAAEDLEALVRLGSPGVLRKDFQALALVTKDVSDPCSIWVSTRLSGYRAVWDQAHHAGFVANLDEWKPRVDIDHVFPKSWANLQRGTITYVRIFPVWAEINRSAGASREKYGRPSDFVQKNGLWYAQELQVLKIIGHPVGTICDPVSIFGAKRNS